jgi:hypothetical protein
VLKVEVYARVRRAVQVDGMSVRRAAREFGLSRKTIRKMLAFSVPPGYQRKKPVSRPKLGPWLGVVDQILENDESQPRKQRHTARRIYDRLREEHAFTGGYTIDATATIKSRHANCRGHRGLDRGARFRPQSYLLTSAHVGAASASHVDAASTFDVCAILG